MTAWALGSVWAQEPVFRCGQAYTNVPQDPARCERVAPQSVTVIEGTRVQQGAAQGALSRPAVPLVSGAPASAGVGASVPEQPSAAVSASQREDMARQILHAEWLQARERHERLLQDQREAQAAGHAQGPAQRQVRQERLVQLQAAVERSQRDIDSLQRELARRPPRASTP